MKGGVIYEPGSGLLAFLFPARRMGRTTYTEDLIHLDQGKRCLETT